MRHRVSTIKGLMGLLERYSDAQLSQRELSKLNKKELNELSLIRGDVANAYGELKDIIDRINPKPKSFHTEP